MGAEEGIVPSMMCLDSKTMYKDGEARSPFVRTCTLASDARCIKISREVVSLVKLGCTANFKKIHP
ncbi:MAG: hypothetical protein QW520_03930 [Methanomassiliicoccales archaeon]